MIGIFLVFKVTKPQGNFLGLHIYLYIYQTCIFSTLMKYILELLGTLFCENVCRLIR
jgi:hypothetical protein